MLVIYVVIPFFGYLWFIRLNESIAEKRFRVNYGMWRWLEMFPHKKNGMWRWKEYWWIEAPFWLLVQALYLSLCIKYFE